MLPWVRIPPCPPFICVLLFFLAYLLASLSSAEAKAPVKTITNLDGVTLDVEILDVTKENVRFKNTDNNKI